MCLRFLYLPFQVNSHTNLISLRSPVYENWGFNRKYTSADISLFFHGALFFSTRVILYDIQLKSIYIKQMIPDSS